MHKCAGVHDAMTTTTNLKHKTSEQHIDLGTSRSSRDYDDLRKIQEWFNQYEPFNPNQPHDDGVNCDLDRVSVTDASIKRSDQVRSLDHLHPGITVEKKKVHINPTLLLSRVIAIVQREEDMLHCFFISHKKGMQEWRICDLIAKAGTLVTSHLLFIHAWSGLDTTTATFG